MLPPCITNMVPAALWVSSTLCEYAPLPISWESQLSPQTASWTASSGADCANRAHSAQFQQTNSSHLFSSGSLHLRHTGPLGRALVSWRAVTDTFKPAGPGAECCRGALQCEFSSCIPWRCTSKPAVLKGMAHSWQPQHAASKESGRTGLCWEWCFWEGCLIIEEKREIRVCSLNEPSQPPWGFSAVVTLGTVAVWQGAGQEEAVLWTLPSMAGASCSLLGHSVTDSAHSPSHSTRAAGCPPLPLAPAPAGKHSKRCFRETPIIFTFYFQHTCIIFKL